MKLTGKPGAGNPHAGFDEAGTGNGSMERIEAPAKGESRRKQLLPRFLRAPRQFSTLLNWAYKLNHIGASELMLDKFGFL
jgi:hypothetical protein